MNTAQAPISVILPARHAADTVGLAIESTLTALSSADELVVINELGDEETINRVRQYSDSRILQIVTNGPSSVSEKLNVGIEAAKSDLIARMDADDVTFPWRFWLQRRRILKSGTDFSFSTCIVFGKALRPLPILPQFPIPLDESDFLKALIVSNPAVHPTMIARKESLDKLGGYRDVPGEDLDLWLRGAVAGHRFERISAPTIMYRYRKNSLSRDENTKSQVRNDESFLRMRMDLLAQLRGANLSYHSQVDVDSNWKHLKEFETELKTRLLFKMELHDLGLNH